jgi:ethylbenzene hydroxylase subunit beta/complex iron-sulfur molybdoenzyme family reductase subunit beta
MLDDEDGPVHKLVRKWEVALPLHPEYGTEPNVFYIPPILPARLTAENNFDESQARVPKEYLESLFGPAVNGALETLQREMDTTRSGGSSELMDTLIAYWWKDMFKPFDQDPGEIEWQRAAALQPDEAVG